jgi:hypothetical protein
LKIVHLEEIKIIQEICWAAVMRAKTAGGRLNSDRQSQLRIPRVHVTINKENRVGNEVPGGDTVTLSEFLSQQL